MLGSRRLNGVFQTWKVKTSYKMKSLTSLVSSSFIRLNLLHNFNV